MPIIIKAKSGDNSYDVIKRFKKAVAASDIVTKARDRRFFKKPSEVRTELKTEKRRLRKRARSLKKMKNISAAVMQRINDRLSK